MKYITCTICGHHHQERVHCSICGAYQFTVSGVKFCMNYKGVTMIRGFRRVHIPISRRTYFSQVDREKLSARLLGHVFHQE